VGIARCSETSRNNVIRKRTFVSATLIWWPANWYIRPTFALLLLHTEHLKSLDGQFVQKLCISLMLTLFRARRPDSSVSTVNRLVAGLSWVRRFIFSNTYNAMRPPPTLLFNCYPCSFSGIKWLEREVDRSPLNSEKLRMNAIYGSNHYCPSWLGEGLPLPLLPFLGCVVSMVVTVTSVSHWKRFWSK
jgi:hypothetical protein